MQILRECLHNEACKEDICNLLQVGFEGTFYYSSNKEPQLSVGNRLKEFRRRIIKPYFGGPGVQSLHGEV